MPARMLANLGLKAFYDLGEDGWKDDQDLNLLKLSVLVQGGVIGKVNATPGSPANQDVYLFGSAHPTNANAVAVYDVDTWKVFAPNEGWKLYNRATDEFELFNGTTWISFAAGAGLPSFAGNALRFLQVNAGETAAQWVDPPAGSGSVSTKGATVRIDSAQTIPDSIAGELLSFVVVEHDSGQFFSNTNPTRLTAADTGWHVASISIAAAGGDPNSLQLAVLKNGTTPVTASAIPFFASDFVVSTVVYLEAGDYIETLVAAVGDDIGVLARFSLALIGQPWPELVGNAGKILAVNGAEGGVEWIDPPSSPDAIPYIVPFGFAAAPESSEVLLIHVFTDSVTFPDNWAGSRGSVGNNPAATYLLTIQKNGTPVGTIAVSAAGVVTFDTDASAVSFVAGDRLSVVGAATADDAIENCGFTLRGERT